MPGTTAQVCSFWASMIPCQVMVIPVRLKVREILPFEIVRLPFQLYPKFHPLLFVWVKFCPTSRLLSRLGDGALAFPVSENVTNLRALLRLLGRQTISIASPSEPLQSPQRVILALSSIFRTSRSYCFWGSSCKYSRPSLVVSPLWVLFKVKLVQTAGAVMRGELTTMQGQQATDVQLYLVMAREQLVRRCTRYRPVGLTRVSFSLVVRVTRPSVDSRLQRAWGKVRRRSRKKKNLFTIALFNYSKLIGRHRNIDSDSKQKTLASNISRPKCPCPLLGTSHCSRRWEKANRVEA